LGEASSQRLHLKHFTQSCDSS